MFKIIYLYVLLLASFTCFASDPEVVNEPKEGGEPFNIFMHKYGNWCGAKHPKDINNADEPINRVDRACMVHDLCYQEKGYLECECDKDLNDELIAGLNERRYFGQEAIYGRAIHLYFNGSPCVGDHSSKVAPSQAVQNVVKKVGEKVIKVIDVAVEAVSIFSSDED